MESERHKSVRSAPTSWSSSPSALSSVPILPHLQQAPDLACPSFPGCAELGFRAGRAPRPHGAGWRSHGFNLPSGHGDDVMPPSAAGCDSAATKALSKRWPLCLVGGFILCECCFAFYVFKGELKLLPFPELLCVCPVNHCWAGGTRKCFPAVARALGSELGSEGPRPKEREGGRFAQPRQERSPRAEPAEGRGPHTPVTPRGCPQQSRAAAPAAMW